MAYSNVYKPRKNTIIMLKLLKYFFIISIVMTGLAMGLAANPRVGLAISGVVMVAAIVSFKKPLPLGFDNKAFSSVALFLALIFGLASFGGISEASRLAALERDDPVAYAAEMKAKEEAAAKRAAEREAAAVAEAEEAAAQRARQQEIDAQANVAAAKKNAEINASKVVEYRETLETELAVLPAFDVSGFTDDVDSINSAIILFGLWAKTYEEGASLPLDEDTAKLRQKFKSAVIKVQTTSLPKLRDAYGPAMSRQLWEADGSARTIGKGYRTIELSAAVFAANRNIKEIQDQMRENFIMLRFTRAQYKWFKGASEYQYYDMEAPKDIDLVKWGRCCGQYTVLE